MSFPNYPLKKSFGYQGIRCRWWRKLFCASVLAPLAPLPSSPGTDGPRHSQTEVTFNVPSKPFPKTASARGG
ncbi:hypothetical protein MTBLM1_70207 [Rhodospirillaceae bacterium LM-1]|nr:hypothetical protein MTBLM1_70207 [Rhodospirillaceae bacterium LM-1]